VVSGVRIIFTPPARAASDSPRRRLSTAKWIASDELLQAVSTEALGPWKSKI
jgi:hypothetical protein